MHLIILALVIYIVFAEWRNQKQVVLIRDLNTRLEKYKKDKTLWYTDVLPAADKLCVFEDAKGKFIISTLDDKAWKKNGEADFSQIKRWVYLEDLKKL